MSLTQFYFNVLKRTFLDNMSTYDLLSSKGSPNQDGFVEIYGFIIDHMDHNPKKIFQDKSWSSDWERISLSSDRYF